MDTEHGQIEAPPKKPRSDKGTSRKKSNPNAAMVSIMSAIDDLPRDQVKRVLVTAAMYHNLRLIEAPVEVANGKRD
jgi:hypothetical protein